MKKHKVPQVRRHKEENVNNAAQSQSVDDFFKLFLLNKGRLKIGCDHIGLFLMTHYLAHQGDLHLAAVS